MNIYFKELGIPLPNVVAVSVDHTGNHPTKNGLDDGEVMLDIEVAGAVAPKAKIAVYFAPNTNKGFLDAINFAIHDTQRKPSVISISWGGPEASADQQSIDAYHEVFLQAAALGVTICTASGDHGTADLDSDHWDDQIHVDHPSVRSDWCWRAAARRSTRKGNDVVWNDGTPFDKTVRGGGGWASRRRDQRVFARAGLPERRKRSGFDREQEARPGRARYRDERDRLLHARAGVGGRERRHERGGSADGRAGGDC